MSISGLYRFGACLVLPLLVAACQDNGRVGMRAPVFDLTRVAADGKDYAGGGDYAKQPWRCVRDNKTGLLWEVKSAQPGLQAAGNTYSWRNTDAQTNGGDAGVADGGKCASSRCDTESYLAALNQAGLCGHKDWRLPRREELGSVVDYSIPHPGPTIVTDFFPHTDPGSYWTSTPFRPHSSGVWVWRFDHGYDYVATKEKALHILAVRGTPRTPAK